MNIEILQIIKLCFGHFIFSLSASEPGVFEVRNITVLLGN